jgi:hypothetical protein
MRQDMADVTPLAIVMNDDNQAVLVPSDVEHDEFANLIRACEQLPHLREVLPACILNRCDPMPQPRLRIRIFFPELLQWPAGYQTHLPYFRNMRKAESTRHFRNMRNPLRCINSPLLIEFSHQRGTKSGRVPDGRIHQRNGAAAIRRPGAIGFLEPANLLDLW